MSQHQAHQDTASAVQAQSPPGTSLPAVDSLPSASRRGRIIALDVIRGFALCGILVANVRPIAGLGAPVAGVSENSAGDSWPLLLVDQRFFPIFSLLFGIGFSLLLESASARVARPRVLLLRRLLVLLAIGLAHHFLLWPGDILTVYAIVGLIVLLPSTWLPRWIVAILAGVLILTNIVIAGGHFAMVPGLFLAGSALTRYGVIDRLGQSAKVPAALAILFAVTAAPALWVQSQTQPDAPIFRFVFPVAGLLVAGLYICGLLLLLRTPIDSALRAIFAPLGRMALTNYLIATMLVLGINQILGNRPERWSEKVVLGIAGLILAVQWIWSTAWLRRFRFGPLEWLWRWATWAKRPSLRRTV